MHLDYGLAHLIANWKTLQFKKIILLIAKLHISTVQEFNKKIWLALFLGCCLLLFVRCLVVATGNNRLILL